MVRTTSDDPGVVGMSATQETVIEALREVADPCCRERGISVVDMGLLEHVEIDDGAATVEIVLTSGWCPFQVDLLAEIEAAVRAVPGVGEAAVSITFERAWSTERMSASAREQLRFLPDPDQVVDRDRYAGAVRAGAPTRAERDPR